jgi:hypothetical protein
MNQSNLSNMPAGLFKCLQHKSRDEIEQYFLHEERILKQHELKRYVITIFDLQQFLESACIQGRHEDMSQEGMDLYFTQAVCRLNDDSVFWRGTADASGLKDYLIRYVIMYFDHAFPDKRPSRDNLYEFVNRHRRYVPPRKVQESMQEACRLFETDWNAIKQMNRRDFSRLYRRQALKHHPDQGGSEKTFVRLTRLYRQLLRKKHK